MAVFARSKSPEENQAVKERAVM